MLKTKDSIYYLAGVKVLPNGRLVGEVVETKEQRHELIFRSREYSKEIAIWIADSIYSDVNYIQFSSLGINRSG